MKRSLLLFIVTCLSSIQGHAQQVPLRVLFIGNSLTYTNDLPQMVAAMSRHGLTSIEVGMIAMPNVSLEDLWHEGRARTELETGDWDVLVMQQGPSSLLSSRDNLVEWSGRFAELSRQSGTEPAIFTVWPSSARRAFLPDVVESYRVAAASCKCQLLPAGAAWQRAWAENPRLALYAADDFHPSAQGSFLAALVIWHKLTGEDPRLIPDQLTLSDGSRARIKSKRGELFRKVVVELSR